MAGLSTCATSVHLNDFVPELQDMLVHEPGLASCPVPVLFYTDDLVLLSRSQSGQREP